MVVFGTTPPTPPCVQDSNPGDAFEIQTCIPGDVVSCAINGVPGAWYQVLRFETYVPACTIVNPAKVSRGVGYDVLGNYSRAQSPDVRQQPGDDSTVVSLRNRRLRFTEQRGGVRSNQADRPNR